MKKHIPNFLTSMNLFIGCIGILQVVLHGAEYGLTFIIIAAVFDFLDGFAARLLKVSSPIGKELDSLADMVSFGVLPAIIMFKMLQEANHSFEYLPYLGLIIAVFSALRLAKFNIDTRQTDQFIGLPTPANALFIAGLPFFNDLLVQYQLPSLTANSWMLSSITVLFSFLLVSELKLIALKFKNFGFKENASKYLLIVIAILGTLIFGVGAIPPIILFYIALSLFNGIKN